MSENFEIEVVRQLTNLQSQLGDIKAITASTNTKVDDLRCEMIGPGGRVTRIESAATRQWWYTVAVFPLIGIGHAVARKFGVNV